jgi:hypothetical protein
MDYNGIVYNAYENIKKDIEGKNYSKDKIEELILKKLFELHKTLFVMYFNLKNDIYCFRWTCTKS